ncbi:MAG TPA: hypothetical protein DC049_11335 [Spirochaetia bacterium]|nr:hypothetical protein [Spirochaetia bacterium]
MKNIVLIMADAHRGDFLGCLDNNVTSTPHLDRIAEKGALFTNAFCTAPLCCPSRQAIVSGGYPSNTGCFTNLHQLPAHTPTFLSELVRAGYHTVLAGKSHMEIHAFNSDLTSRSHAEYMKTLGWNELYEISGSMLRTGIRCAYSEFLRDSGMLSEVLTYHRKWHYFMDSPSSGDPAYIVHPWPFDEHFDESRFVTDQAVNWLKQYSGSKPFFMQVGYYQPNHPRDPLPRFLEKYQNQKAPFPGGAQISVPEKYLASRTSYRAEISQIDEYAGEIFGLLEKKNMLDNTFFIYTSDHGCSLYERYGHPELFGGEAYANFFQAAVHVPLLAAGGGFNEKRKITALTETIDLGKTICELAGIESHRFDQGKSLIPLLSGKIDQHRNSIYSEMACDRMLFNGKYKLMRGDPLSDKRLLWKAAHLDRPVNITPSVIRLFDLKNDPYETCDLAGNYGYKNTLAEMNELMLQRISENTRAQPYLNRGEYRPVIV